MPKPFVLTQRDVDILQSLSQVRYLTVQHLQWLHWTARWREHERAARVLDDPPEARLLVARERLGRVDEQRAGRRVLGQGLDAVWCLQQQVRAAADPPRPVACFVAIELEGHCYSRLRSSEDFREGVEAFHSKRKPAFVGR